MNSAPKPSVAGQPYPSSSSGKQKRRKGVITVEKMGMIYLNARKGLLLKRRRKNQGFVFKGEATSDHANFARDLNWEFLIQFNYNPFVHDAHDAYMSVSSST